MAGNYLICPSKNHMRPIGEGETLKWLNHKTQNSSERGERRTEPSWRRWRQLQRCADRFFFWMIHQHKCCYMCGWKHSGMTIRCMCVGLCMCVCVHVSLRCQQQMSLASVPNDCCHAEVRDSSGGSWEAARLTKAHTLRTPTRTNTQQCEQVYLAVTAGQPGFHRRSPSPSQAWFTRRRRRRANADCTRPVTSAECAVCAKQRAASAVGRRVKPDFLEEAVEVEV